MKQLRSLLPYLTDQQWTEMVMRRAMDEDPELSISEEERIERAQISLSASHRLEDLGYAPVRSPDMQEGASDEASIGECILVREMYYECRDVFEVAEAFGMDKELVRKIIDGVIWPYAGGPLSLPILGGINPNSAYTYNQRRFVKSVIALALTELSANDFEIICNNNGMSVEDAKRLVKNMEPTDERLSKQRYRGVLVRHSEGQELEKALVAFRRKSRIR